jgi:fructose-1,6-bisphosphatase I
MLILIGLLVLPWATGYISRQVDLLHQRVVVSSSSSSLYSNSKGGRLDKIKPVKAIDRKTLKRFLQVEIWRSPEKESLYPILSAFEAACRDINRLMRRISTDNLDGYHGGVNGTPGTVNIQGEDQKKLDVIANRILKTALSCTGQVSVLASEEEDEPTLCSDLVGGLAASGTYTAVFDPLDGSSNIDPGLPTGTILGIFKNPSFGNPSSTSLATKRGSELVAAAYCLYSSSTHLALTMKSGLHMFTLDDVSGEFYLTRSNVRIPRSGPIYSFNDANDKEWSPAVRHFVSDLKSCSSPYMPSTKKRSSRYAGSLVADLHNIIINGGIFGYPGTVSKPEGKLRLVYEGNPMALIVEDAGGSASTGFQRVLDVPVTGVHQRIPLFIGSFEEVAAVDKYCSFYGSNTENI